MSTDQPGSPNSFFGANSSPSREEHGQISPESPNSCSLGREVIVAEGSWENTTAAVGPSDDAIEYFDLNIACPEDFDEGPHVARLPTPNNTDDSGSEDSSAKIPPADKLKTTGLDDASQGGQSSVNERCEEEETSVLSNPFATIPTELDFTLESAIRILLEEHPNYGLISCNQQRDIAVMLVEVLKEYDRSQGTNMSEEVLLETIRWTVKDGHSIFLPVVNSALGVLDNTPAVGSVMPDTMTKPLVDVQSKTTEEKVLSVGKHVLDRKKREPYKCQRCGEKKKKHICPYDAAGDRKELKGSKEHSEDSKMSAYVMMLDAWTDQGYAIDSSFTCLEKGIVSSAPTTDSNGDECRGTIAAEILQGMRQSQERYLTVSEEAIATIEESEGRSSSPDKDISSSDLGPPEERELYVSTLGLRRIQQELERQMTLKEKLAKLKREATIDAKPIIETNQDNQRSRRALPIESPLRDTGDVGDDRGGTSDEELVAFLGDAIETRSDDDGSENEEVKHEEV